MPTISSPLPEPGGGRRGDDTVDDEGLARDEQPLSYPFVLAHGDQRTKRDRELDLFAATVDDDLAVGVGDDHRVEDVDVVIDRLAVDGDDAVPVLEKPRRCPASLKL